jgi:hypothetical protein
VKRLERVTMAPLTVQLPTGDFTTHQLMTFMCDHFNFDNDQTVPNMGAHSIGRAFAENSGYEGQFAGYSIHYL